MTTFTETGAAGAPVIGIIMGSSSDWDVMKHAVAVLEEFGVPHDLITRWTGELGGRR